MYYNNILETIGNTPLVKLNKITKHIPATVLAKVEYFNPGHSVKDRIGIKMIEDAEQKGILKPGGTIIEGTSGNTGMGLALAAIMKGYKCIFTVSDKQSKEKIDLLRAMGAEVIVCPTSVEATDPRSYYSVAKKLNKEIPNSFYPNQYDHAANTKAHYETTGPEIWEQTEGRITHFISGVGTGGTISGTGRYLKEKNPDIKIWGIDTYGSVFKKYHETGEFDEKEIYPYITEGIGEDIIPENVDFKIIDYFEKVTDKDAFVMTRRLAKEEGLLVGNSAGSAIAGLLQMKDRLKAGDLVVVLLPDHGTRYVGKAFNDDWMRERGFLEEGMGKARDIVAAKSAEELITIAGDKPLQEAIALLQKHNISQIPVTNGSDIVGAVTENTLYAKIIDNPDFKHLKVENVMEEPLPVVEADTPSSRISEIIRQGNGAVLVSDNGKFHIVTKYDIIHQLARS
ncbi:MAG: pyridoxal-phosphate dependent enzyme [Bacteroidia bacterium]